MAQTKERGKRIMAVESKRGCGYRKVGGLYIVTKPGILTLCDRMPIKLEACKHCEEMGFNCGFKPARGWTWVVPEKLLKGDHYIPKYKPGAVVEVEDKRKGLFAKLFSKPILSPGLITQKLCPEDHCAVCRPALMGERAGLLWINPKHYTPGSFIGESAEMGMSRRIAAIFREGLSLEKRGSCSLNVTGESS
jgi:hypothetical protein